MVMVSNGINIGRRRGPRMGGGGVVPWYRDGSPLSNSIVSFWKLDEASGNRADSVGSNTLTDHSVPSAAGLVYPLAADFTPASSHYLSVASNASLQTGDVDFWISAWVYLDDAASAGQIVAKDLASNRDYELCVNSTGASRFQFIVIDTGGSLMSASIVMTINTATWYHLIGWHDSTLNTVNLTVNNGAVTSTSTGGNAPKSSAGSELQIAARQFVGSRQFLDGRVSAVVFGKNYVPTANDRTRLDNWGSL